MVFFRSAHGWRGGGEGGVVGGVGQKWHPPLNLSLISFDDETWYSCALPKKDSKYI